MSKPTGVWNQSVSRQEMLETYRIKLVEELKRIQMDFVDLIERELEPQE